MMAMEAACPLLERSEALLKRIEQLTRQQRHAGRIALGRHLLLSNCVHVKSCIWCRFVLSDERVDAFSHAENEKASKYLK